MYEKLSNQWTNIGVYGEFDYACLASVVIITDPTPDLLKSVKRR